MLEEESEMQELRLQLDGTHEVDCKKPGETLTTGEGFVTDWNLVRSLWNLNWKLESRLESRISPRILKSSIESLGSPRISES